MIFVLNNIRSAWNVGAIMRTADAVGASIILIGYTPKPVGDTLKLIIKTSIGAEKTVQWQHFDHGQEVIERYSGSGYTNIGIEISDTSQDLFQFLKSTKKLNLAKTLLWFGNEISGLEKDLIKELDYEVHLPMLGMKESLNVASTVCTVGYMFLERFGNLPKV